MKYNQEGNYNVEIIWLVFKDGVCNVKWFVLEGHKMKSSKNLKNNNNNKIKTSSHDKNKLMQATNGHKTSPKIKSKHKAIPIGISLMCKLQ